MAPHNDTTAFTTRLESGLAHEARKLASKRGVSLNHLVAEALREEIEREKLVLAREGYAHFAAEDAAEAEEGMGDWSEWQERGDAR